MLRRHKLLRAPTRLSCLPHSAGAGGDEAGIWAGDLLRMYQRYALGQVGCPPQGQRISWLNSSCQRISWLNTVLHRPNGARIVTALTGTWHYHA